MKIGKLMSVDLREVWANEAKDFTQWLSENLDCLGDALDMTLDLVGTEEKVDESRFSIDILAEDENEEPVIIENQLEKSNHTHLGQIVTYATNMEVKTVIWITKDARTEHINAVNWLNEFSDKNFFLIQVEALQIDNSNPAPFFSVICRPSTESKSLGQSKKVLDAVIDSRRRRRDVSDTIVVPARKEGFDRVFLGENCWYSIRLRKERLNQLKYIAGYQVAPISAITHTATIKEIVPCDKEPGKYKVLFTAPAKEIKPIKLGEKSKIQGPAYCQFEKLKSAKTVDELLASPPASDDEAA